MIQRALIALTLVAAVVYGQASHQSVFSELIDSAPNAFRGSAYGPGGDDHRRLTTQGNKFVASLLGSKVVNNSFAAGQEVRLVVATAYAANVSHNQQEFDVTKGNDAKVAGLFNQDLHKITQRLKLGNYTAYNPAFNVSGPSKVRVRVINARTTRGDTASAFVQCSSTSQDVWSEHWAMGRRELVWGRHIVLSGFVTFTVPPFHYRLCVKDVNNVNNTRDGFKADAGTGTGWMDFLNFKNVHLTFHEPLFLWRTMGSPQVGDYSSIEITANLPETTQFIKTNASWFSLEDSVKLVPWGMPCSYEKTTSLMSYNPRTSGKDQYCGSNAVNTLSGAWANMDCELEGSVAGGVARVGGHDVNKFASSSSANEAWTNTRLKRTSLVAYLKMPAAGNYDVCVSTANVRRMAWLQSDFDSSMAQSSMATYAQNAMPVWVKAYDASASTCTQAYGAYERVWADPNCKPRKTAVVVAAASATVSFATIDETPGSWGEIKFTASSGTLNYGAATQWEFGSAPNYYNLTGGDQFRIVPAAMFSETATATAGNLGGSVRIESAKSLYSSTWSTVTRAVAPTYSSNGDLSVANMGVFKQYSLGMPTYGSKSTVGTGSGCHWAAADNYGASSLNGNPNSVLCAALGCSKSDTDAAGPTASADLGGNPRVGYAPWALDGTGSTAYGYVRFPQAGQYRVCYRKAGESSWRVLSGTMGTRTTSNATLTPRALTAGYTYHANDTRAETWGPVAIKSLAGATLTKQAWNYYTASSATAVGSAFKMVKTTENCYTSTAQARTYSMNPGSMEMMGSLGSADDSSTATSTIYFYVKFPAYSTTIKYRMCFRFAATNWHALNDPNFVAHTYMTAGTAFAPMPTSSITFTLADQQSGSWGKFLFNRSATTTPSLNADSMHGDMVRLVRNVSTDGVEVGCDRVWDASSTVTNKRFLAQVYDATMADTNLGMVCDYTSANSADACYSANLAPTSNGVVATNPYTNILPNSDKSGVGWYDGTAAFITIPAGIVNSLPVAYKVCYKQARFANWIEAKWDQTMGTALTVTKARTVTAAAPTGGAMSGQYSYVQLTATAAAPIYTQFDLVKLVPFASTCEVAAVTNAGYELYTAMSGVSTTACVVDGTNSTMITTSCQVASITSTNARAYMTFPTVRASTTAPGATTSYRVCYMARQSTTAATQNWHDVSGTTPFTVTNHGITYTLLSRPYAYGTLGIKIMSGYQRLNTNANMDAMKVIYANVACADTSSTDQPSAAGTSSTHRGIEYGYSTSGITNVGPTDMADAREARVDVVLTAASTSHKVCYKPYGKGWVEVLQAEGSARVVAQTSDYIIPATREVTGFTVNSQLTGAFSNQPNYYGTSWSVVATGGAATTDGTNHWFRVSYSATQTAGLSFKVKFVESDVEGPAGTYTTVAGANCLSEGTWFTYTTTASTSDNIDINLPMKGGKYLVCFWSATTGVWYQAAANGVVAQPMQIVPNKMSFAADSTAGTVTVYDWHAQNGTSFAGLDGADNVYITNFTYGTGAACGAVNDWQNVAVATAKVNLTTSPHGADTTNKLAVRSATITLPSTPRTGAYVVCVQRTQAAATNASGYPPFLKANWYQVMNTGSAMGAGSNFLVITDPSKLGVTCPTFNSTYKLRTGAPFAVTVEAQDSTGNVVPYTKNGIKRFGVTAAPVGFTLQSSMGECAPSSAATYGYAKTALTQYMSEGKVGFSLTALSACAGGSCSLSFTSADGLTSTTACTFDVQPTAVFGVEISLVPTSCDMGSWCTFRAVAIHADGGVAHTVSTAVSFAVTGWTATTALADRLPSGGTFNLAGGSMNFVNGVADFRVKFMPSAYSATASQTVTITATASGKTSPAVTVTVNRPILSAIHVIDVYPVASSGAPLLPLQPSWEPYQASNPRSFRGGDDTYMGTSTVTAAGEYHLVAGQDYGVTLRAVATTGATTAYVNTDHVYPAGWNVNVDQTATGLVLPATNKLLRGGASTEWDDGAFSADGNAWSMGKKDIKLRFRNAGGCADGCTIPFTFGGSTLTASITTPVRSIATELKVIGCAATLDALATSTATSCTGVSSTVNKGWYVNVSAVDQFGEVDKFFDGDVLAVLAPAAAGAAARGVKLTTVPALAAGSPALNYVKVAARNGFATVALTLTQPCASGCDVQLMSNWGTNLVAAGSFVATPNTVRLEAKLNTVLPYCASTSTTECSYIAGYSRYNETHAFSTIYRDTRVCMSVTAVDSNGDATLYETNWIGYFARDITSGSTPQALTLTDDASNQGFVARYKPLKNSKANFCFTISGFTSVRQVEVHFVAQRFGTAATYWSHGTTGTSKVGPLRVWPTKLVADVLLASTTVGDVVRGGSAGIVSGEWTGSDVTMRLGFLLKDHFNNSIVPAEVVSTEASKYLAIRMDDATGKPLVTKLGDEKVRGTLNVTLAATSTVNVTSTTVEAGITVNAACLGCTISFDLVDQAGVVAGTMRNSMDVWLGANVTLYIVNRDATAVRRLAFNPGTSPRTSYWINGTATTATTNAGPTHHVTACFTDTTLSCQPEPASLNLASCDARGSTTLGASATSGLQMRVYVMPAGVALTSASEPLNGTSQVDIMNTYTVSISFGNQVLSCLTTYGTACTGDVTAAPSQTLQAYGATVRDAIGQFMGASDASIRTTNFYTIGVSSSAYLAINSTTSKYDAVPSVGGAFSASASGAQTATGITLTSSPAYGFYWRPMEAASTIKLLATAVDADACNQTANMKYACSGGSGCSTMGLAQTGYVGTSLAFAYASQAIPHGETFPMSFEVVDSSSLRIAGASGALAVAVESWTGCNNGGTLSASGTTVANGRATVMVSFSAPCQNCVLRFTFTPSSAQSAMYSSLSASPANLYVLSSSINVVDKATIAPSQVVVTTASPATALVSGTTDLTIATPVDLTLTPRALFGRLPFATTSTSTSIKVGITARVASTGTNWWWVGNGGALRASATATNLHQHYQTMGTLTAAATMSSYFSRTCTTCYIVVSYKIGSGSAVNFQLPASFRVTTAASQTTLVGFPPRMVGVGKDVAIGVWATGSEDPATVPVAGVAPSTTASTAVTPSISPVNASNGNGGAVTSTSWVFNNALVYRMSFSAPCQECTVSVGTVSFPIRITTRATYLRPGADAQLTPEQAAMGPMRPSTMLALGEYRQIPLMALDDMGFVDQGAGPFRGCGWPYVARRCSWQGVAPVPTLTQDGVSTSSFPVNGNSLMLFADQGGVAVGSGSTMYEGLVNYNMSFSRPQRDVIPVFTASINGAAVTSAYSAMRPFPVPKYAVSAGTSNLAISVVTTTPLTQFTTSLPGTFHVAMVGTPTGLTGKYVALEANNAINITAGAGCPAHTINASGTSLMRGYMPVVVTFTAATAVGVTCDMYFTAMAGTGSCAAATDCTTMLSLTVSKLVATTWDVVRPSAIDNGIGSTATPLHAHAGRTMKLRAQLKGPSATGALVPVVGCATCTLTVTSTDCGFTTASATATAGTAWAEVSLSFADNGAAAYTCTISVAATGPDATGTATGALSGPDRASTTVSYTVNVCKSSAVKLLTNATQYRGMMLRTGVAYNFYAVMVDAAGAQCWGDSQDDATTLTIEAIDGGAAGTPNPALAAINVNATSTTTAAFANGGMAAAARTSVTAVGGAFNFRVVFTNSTVALGMTAGVKLRVTASSSTPVISSVATSGAVDTVIAAARLQWGRGMIPQYVVKSRPFLTGPMRATSIEVVAVDGIPDSWATMGLSGRPNVAAAASAFGNDLAVQWDVTPTPPVSAPFPMAFTGGARAATLSAGRAMWASAAFTGNDGIYGLNIGTQAPGVMGTPAQSIVSQTVSQLVLNTLNFTTTSAPTCTSNCILPNGTFATLQNSTINNGAPFLSIGSLTAFNLSVTLTDGARPVLGDSDSVVSLTLNAGTGTSVQMGAPPAYTQRGTLYARVREGRATFSLGFIGDTLLSGGLESFASLTFGCPATRPAWLLQPGEAAANPCTLSTTVSTQSFQVVDASARGALLNSPVVTASKGIVKAALGFSSFALLNVTLFKERLAGALVARGIRYLHAGNIERVLGVTRCTVSAMFPLTGDLGTTVCGPTGACLAPSNLATCPNEVLACACPTFAPRTVVLSRFLLQNSTTPAANSTVRAELAYELHRADTFPARTAEEVAAEYVKVQAATIDALRNDVDLVNGFQVLSVGLRQANEMVTTIPPTTPPPTPPTQPPPPPPPPTTTPATTAASSASPLALAIALLLAALLSLLA